VHLLDESHILLFLVQVLILLTVARALGALCEELKIPALAGEILAGVVLGPTLLGRLAPALQTSLFPDEHVQSTMLETVSWLGVFFLLLASGFHVDVAHALRWDVRRCSSASSACSSPSPSGSRCSSRSPPS
jgi:Kef-type K+ transport system membrane component KefB